MFNSLLGRSGSGGVAWNKNSLVNIDMVTFDDATAAVLLFR